MTDQAPLPTFLIIGAQKSATRWLRSNLGKHPEIYAASEELSFFNMKFRRGEEWYRDQFEGWDGEPIVGEATPGYMMWKHDPERVASRIHETIPDVKLVALLRNPIERANSAIVHHKRRGRVRKRTRLVRAARKRDPKDDRLNLVAAGWYARSLAPYVELFSDQLLVILHDDIREDPEAAYRRVLEHLGADPDYVPPDLAEVAFSNQSHTENVLTPEDQQALWPMFEEDVYRLQFLIRRDLSQWKPSETAIRGWNDVEISGWAALTLPLAERSREMLGWVDKVVLNTDEASFDRPTPCPDWNVRDLIAHMAYSAAQFPKAFTEHPAELDLEAHDPREPWRMLYPYLDSAVGDPATWEKAILSGPGSPRPARYDISLSILNLLVHGWDLAVATGQPAQIPDRIAAPMVDFTRVALPLLQRAGPTVYGPEIELPGDASAGDQLVALLGRDPELALSV